MVSIDFKKDTWIYILIAAVLALISIFTPLGTTDADFRGYPPDTILWWLSLISYRADQDPPWFGSRAATIWTLGITCMSIAIL